MRSTPPSPAPVPATAPSSPQPSSLWAVLRVVLFVLAVAIAVLIGVSVATLAAAFALTASLPFAVIVWTAVSLLLVLLLVAAAERLLLRRRAPRRTLLRRRTPAAVAVVATLLLAALGGATVLAPVPGASAPSSPEAPRYADLPTGSRVAYWKVDAPEPHVSEVPIVYLHGGPGGYISPGNVEALAPLAATGHDVYLFDQPGGGSSPDLPTSAYSLKRSLADIDALREEIGAERIIVLGHSAGGFLAAAYAASHPTHVEKAVLVSPGTYDVSEEGLRAAAADEAAMAGADDRHDERDPLNDRLASLSSPRLIAALTLLDAVGPDAASNLYSQEDGKRASALALGRPTGVNLYENRLLTADFEAQWQATIAKLRTLDVPTLLVRAQYDYVDWPGQHALGSAGPDARTVYLPDAEHDPWDSALERTNAVIADFVLDREQPLHSGDANPALTATPER
ncbi:alpha/beta hydrolase [Rathayibacter festucae]|uniref:alpha/beta hydrolase n=1 Tax=Rathayibacter festucae TaxID=110937 RepID=UPI001FB50D37|nr:alpha/beta hydrolase [Rathayibacter festucae]MCJ1699453.1 alpha/beta hydrolase [Rathayibacter festucae]